MKHSMKRALALLLALLLAVPAFAFAEPLDNELDFAFEEEAEADVAADESVGEISFDLSELTEEEPAAPPADDDSEAEVSLDDEEPKAEEEESAEDVASEDAATDLTEEETSEEGTAEDEAALEDASYDINFKFWDSTLGTPGYRTVTFTYTYTVGTSAVTLSRAAMLELAKTAAGSNGGADWYKPARDGKTYKGIYYQDGNNWVQTTEIQTGTGTEVDKGSFWPRRIEKSYTFWAAYGADVTFYSLAEAANYDGATKYGSTVTVLEGQTVAKPTTDPTKTGYTFRYWTAAAPATIEYDAAHTPAEYIFGSAVNADTKLRAYWVAKDSKVIYLDKNGDAMLHGSNAYWTVSYGSAIGANHPAFTVEDGVLPVSYPSADQLYNIKFQGWQKVGVSDAPIVTNDDAGAGSIGAEVVAADSVTYMAVYKPEPKTPVKVYFLDDNGGTHADTNHLWHVNTTTGAWVENDPTYISCAQGEVPVYPYGTPVKQSGELNGKYVSYTFKNWVDENGNVVSDFPAVPDPSTLPGYNTNDPYIKYYAVFTPVENIVACVAITPNADGSGQPAMEYYTDLNAAVADAIKEYKKTQHDPDTAVTITLLNNAKITSTIKLEGVKLAISGAYSIYPADGFTGTMIEVAQNAKGAGSELSLTSVTVNAKNTGSINANAIVVQQKGKLTLSGVTVKNGQGNSTYPAGGIFVAGGANAAQIAFDGTNVISGNKAASTSGAAQYKADLYVGPGVQIGHAEAIATTTIGSAYVDAEYVTASKTWRAGEINLAANSSAKNVYLAYKSAKLTIAGATVDNLYVVHDEAGNEVAEYLKADQASPAAGTYTAGSAVAKIVGDDTTNYYDTLSDALTAVGQGQTIMMIQNYTWTSTSQNGLTKAYAYTLDLAGTKLTLSTTNDRFFYLKDGNLTLTDSGATKGKISVTNGRFIRMRANATLNLNNIVVESVASAFELDESVAATSTVNILSGASVKTTNATAIDFDYGTVNINGGTVEGKTGAIDMASTATKLTIDGGTLRVSGTTGSALAIAAASATAPVVSIKDATLTSGSSTDPQVDVTASGVNLGKVTSTSNALTVNADQTWKDNKNGTYTLVKQFNVQFFKDSTTEYANSKQVVIAGEKATEYIPAAVAGETFLGWSETENDKTHLFDFKNKLIEKNYKLYAIWDEVDVNNWEFSDLNPNSATVDTTGKILTFKDLSLTYNNGYVLTYKLVAPEAVTTGVANWAYRNGATGTWKKLSFDGTVTRDGVQRGYISFRRSLDPETIRTLLAGGGDPYLIGDYYFALLTDAGKAKTASEALTPGTDLTYDGNNYKAYLDYTNIKFTNGTETPLEIVEGFEVFTVTFDPNGGTLTGDATVRVPKGKCIADVIDVATKLTNPIRTNWSFVNWVDTDGNEFDITKTTAQGGTVISANTTLTATWAAAAVAVTTTKAGATTTVYYNTLAAALAAINGDKTNATATSIEVVLLQDQWLADATTVDYPITLKLYSPNETGTNAGHTLTLTTGLTVSGGASLTIDGTVKNSKVVGPITVGWNPNKLTSGALTLNGGTYVNSAATAGTAVDDSITRPVITVDAGCQNATVTITNAVIDGTTVVNTAAKTPNGNGISFAGKGTFTVTDSKVTGGTYAVKLIKGDLTIDGSDTTKSIFTASKTADAYAVWVAPAAKKAATLTLKGTKNKLVSRDSSSATKTRTQVYYVADATHTAALYTDDKNLTLLPIYAWTPATGEGAKAEYQVADAVALLYNNTDTSVVTAYAKMEDAIAAYDSKVNTLKVVVNQQEYIVFGADVKNVLPDELYKVVKTVIASMTTGENKGVKIAVVPDYIPANALGAASKSDASKAVYVATLMASGYTGVTLSPAGLDYGTAVEGKTLPIRTIDDEDDPELTKQTKEGATFKFQLVKPETEPQTFWQDKKPVKVIHKDEKGVVAQPVSTAVVTDTVLNKLVVNVEDAKLGTFTVVEKAVAQVYIKKTAFDPKLGETVTTETTEFYGTIDDAVAAVNANAAGADEAVLTLLAACTAGDKLTFAQTVTLDLNGYTLTTDAGDNIVIANAEAGVNPVVTVKSTVAGGKITAGTGVATLISVGANGALVLDDGTLSGATKDQIATAATTAKVTINGGVIAGNIDAQSTQGKLVIEGGKIDGTVYRENNANALINGGLYKLNPDPCNAAGGYYSTANTDATTKAEGYLYAVLQNPVASITTGASTVYYASIKDAIDAAPVNTATTIDVVYAPVKKNANGTYSLADDLVLYENVVVKSGKIITLDLHQRPLRNDVNDGAKDTIYVEFGATLTIQNGELGTVPAGYAAAAAAAKLTGGFVDNISNGVSALHNDGVTTVQGGKFTRSAEAGKAWNSDGSNTGSTIVNHNTLTLNTGDIVVENNGVFSAAIENGKDASKVTYTRDNLHPTLTMGATGTVAVTGGIDGIHNSADCVLVVSNTTFDAMNKAAGDKESNTRSMIFNEGKATTGAGIVFKDTTTNGWTVGIMNRDTGIEDSGLVNMDAAITTTALTSEAPISWYVDKTGTAYSTEFLGELNSAAKVTPVLPKGYAWKSDTRPTAPYTSGNTVSVEVAKNLTTGVSYGSINDAIAAAGLDNTIQLQVEKWEENVAVTTGKRVTLDLNGCELANKVTGTGVSATTSHTIQVAYTATLTIVNTSATKDAVVDNTSYKYDGGRVGYAALQNLGRVTIGQTSDTKKVAFTRSKETGYDWTNPAKATVAANSFDTIMNVGEMTIVDAEVSNMGVYSDAIYSAGILTIKKGTYTGGFATINNAGTLTVEGGTFASVDKTPAGTLTSERVKTFCTAALINNTGTANISGATMTRDNEFTNVVRTEAAGKVDIKTELTLNGTAAKFGMDVNYSKVEEAKLADDDPTTNPELFTTGGSVYSLKNTLSLPSGYAWTWKEAKGEYQATKSGLAYIKETKVTYSKLSDALTAATAGQTVQLIGDVAESVTITKNLNLDLNGHSLSNTPDTAGHTITVNSGVTLNLYNSATVREEPGASGLNKGVAVASTAAVKNLMNASAALYNNGTVNLGKLYVSEHPETYDPDADPIYYSVGLERTVGTSANTFHTAVNNGTMTVYNAVVKSAASDKTNNAIENTRTLDIKGGTFSYGKYTIHNGTGATVTVSGGDFNSNSDAALMNQGTATLTGGSFRSNSNVAVNAVGTLIIKGTTTMTNGGTGYSDIAALADTDIGTVKAATNNYTVPATYSWESKEDTTAGTHYQLGGYVAYIQRGSTFKYATLADAVKAAVTGDTIVLVADCATTATLEVPATKTITLDLNGYNVTANSGIVVKGGLTVMDSVHYPKVNKNGVMVEDDTQAPIIGSITSTGTAITVESTGSLTIAKTNAGGTITTVMSRTMPKISGQTAIKSKSGKLVINSGTFQGTVDGVVFDRTVATEKLVAGTDVVINDGLFLAGSGEAVKNVLSATGTGVAKIAGFVKDGYFNKTINIDTVYGDANVCTTELKKAIDTTSTTAEKYFYLATKVPVTLNGGSVGSAKGVFKKADGTEATSITTYIASGEKFSKQIAGYIEPTLTGYKLKANAEWLQGTGTTPFDMTTPIIAATTLTANWEIKYFTVTIVSETGAAMKDASGTAIPTSLQIQEGQLITGLNDPATTDGTTFVGWFYAPTYKWNLATQKVTENVTLTANFNYPVKWNNEDGTSLGEDETYAYNADPVYKGTQPTKAASEGHTYFFDGWDPAITKVTAPATYKAKFSIVAATVDGKPYKSFAEALEASKTAADPTITLTEPVAEPYKLAEGETLKVKGNEDGSKLTVVPADETKKILENTKDGVTTYTVVDKLVVTFDITPVATIEVAAGTTAAQVKDQFPTPTKDYYTLAGWKAGETEITDAYVFEADTTLTPVWADTVTFQPTLNLASYIGMFVYIHIPEGEDAADYTVKSEYKSYIQENNQNVELSSLKTKDRKRGDEEVSFYRFDALHAGSDEMADVVKVSLLKKGEVVETKEFTIADAAKEQLANPDTSAKEATLYRALLQYGHHAQILFENNTDKLPSTEGAPALVAIPEKYKAAGDPTVAGVTKFEAKLALDTTVDMNVYLTLAEGTALEDLTITVTDKAGKAQTFTAPKMKSGKVYFKVQDIYSDQMSDDYKITVTTKAGATGTWTRSLMTCAYEMQQNNPSNDKLKNVLMALYQYHVAAAAVFENM